jgi:hypothetical protein
MSHGIHKKLLEFQRLGISIIKGKVNAHFKNKYANIDEVLEKVRPALSQVGIVMAQLPTETGLRTTLTDPEDGSFVEGFLPFLAATKPQEIGSNLTYLRRYSLVAMLGLEDDDDDGQAAQTPAKAATKPVEPMERLTRAKTLKELQTAWVSLTDAQRHDPELDAMKNQRKTELTNQSA